jgi:predicted ABC-type ATPase
VNVDPLASLRAALLDRPVLLFIAGPNGAGKTTFFEYYLEPLGLPFVNADRVARALRDAEPALTPAAVDRRAFAEAETLRRTLLEAGASFCTESVFSDPVGAKRGFLEQARRAGYFTTLVFIGIAGPDLSAMRVEQRVRHGGHDVPDEKLRQRFPRTLENLYAAIAIVDEAWVLDNSSYAAPYRVIAVYRGGRLEATYPPMPAWAGRLPQLDADGGGG